MQWILIKLFLDILIKQLLKLLTVKFHTYIDDYIRPINVTKR